MSVLNVALIGSDEFARRLGKKGDSRDIDSYVHKESKDGGVRVWSLLRPLKHQESIRRSGGSSCVTIRRTMTSSLWTNPTTSEIPAPSDIVL